MGTYQELTLAAVYAHWRVETIDKLITEFSHISSVNDQVINDAGNDIGNLFDWEGHAGKDTKEAIAQTIKELSAHSNAANEIADKLKKAKEDVEGGY